MYFEVDTEMYDVGELEVEFIRSAEKEAEEAEAFEIKCFWSNDTKRTRGIFEFCYCIS